MEFENLITLIKTVSDVDITDFKYEKNDIKICMRKQAVQQNVVSQATPVVQTTFEEQGLKQEQTGSFIKSPLVGRFYIAPAEDADPFVKVGDCIKKGQTVAIVEAMKLMNDIESEFDGIIAEVLVNNGEAVEYGQPLFRIV